MFAYIVVVTFVIVADVLPLKIRQIGMTISFVSVLLSHFIAVKFFPFSIASIEFHGSMFLFATICLLSAIFIIYYVSEMKGKTSEEIMNMLK